MTSTIAVPVWLALLVALLAAWAALDRLLVPSVRWLLRQRVNRALEEANRRLQIRLPPFKLTKRRVLIDRLVYDPEVVRKVEETAAAEGVPRQVLVERVERYANEIVPSFNAYIYFRFGYWLSRRIARALYRVRLGARDEDALASIDPEATVVFVMNHRSNMDYVLVAYLVAERAALSYAVGEWARIWPLEQLIRSMGAYFVRRRSRNDLYRLVLARYVAMATREGLTQAVYPEGGLSRDGRLQPPKLGLLDYMLREFDRKCRDVVFVPVGINYDRVLEDRTLLLDGRPGAERKGALRALATTFGFLSHNLLLLLRGRWFRFGYACVNFGLPLSTRDFLAARGVDLGALPKEERFERVGELAGELMGRVQRAIPALPVALVSTLFHRQPDRRFSELELKAAAQELIGELERGGSRVYVPRRSRDYAIQVGLRMLVLRHLVVQEEGLYRARPEERALIAYYAHSVARP
ncbi:MAG: 1-acyl-sn-glycerol-3-phosphate acyltransferase [Thermoanaerobaculia bacterium]|nr:1-acyl-sn-glycerol-3-phosphate acyltransferase [Thermoanaerobaculia bacterium]